MPFITQGKTNWKFLLIVVVLAAIVGGYLWLISEKRVEFPRVKVLKEVDTRLLLTEKNAEEVYEKECRSKESDICYDFNYDSPTTEILYLNQEKGISLKIPYNPNWGTKGFKILPYWEGSYKGGHSYDYEDKLEFGPLTNCFSRAYCRVCSLYFLSPHSIEGDTSSVPYFGEVDKETIVQEEINGYMVISYEVTGGDYCGDTSDEGNCNLPLMEVIGKKYNYVFAPTRGVLFEGDKIEEGKIGFSCSEEMTRMTGIKDIRQDIIKTIQFIE